MNLLPFISLVSLTPSSLGFLSQWSDRSELGEWRDVTSPLHMMKGMRKDINNNNKIYKIFFQLLLLLFMSFPTHSLLSHLATLTGRRERVWRRNRETDGTVKWDEREGIVRIGLRLHHSFCLSESNPYNPFSFPSPLVPRGSSFIMWRDREALRCFSARGASAGVHYPFAPRHRRGGDHEVETAGGRY